MNNLSQQNVEMCYSSRVINSTRIAGALKRK